MTPATAAGPLLPGRAYPLGAHLVAGGVNFALVAPHARAVELCLFDPTGKVELQRRTLPACTDGAWHGFLPGARAGLVYGYRVHGDDPPQPGQCFNPAKLLLDPYAREIVGTYLAQPAFCSDDPADTGAIALKARIVDDGYDWGEDRAPRVPEAATVLYEVHVQGFTRLHPDVPAALRGTYAGLATPVMLEHLQRLGVTAISLLPVQQRADEARLQQAGLSNYWGYSSIGFFAVEPRYWSGRDGTTPASEFRDMVRALHARGIEVLLDVVYNHTAETDEFGPTLSFRGIDNALYYHLLPRDPARYENWTGCGNVLNLAEPRVLQLVMDSLRHWVEAMHVDGFRFDLAPVLGRDAAGFSAKAAFFQALAQDPVLAGVKLIAEPWDMGPGGYRLGQFPPRWLEWNDRYRDCMRAFWLQRAVTVGEFAQRFAGSSDVFREHGKSPLASVNFITAHDGFTLQDVVSYEQRHNLANGEANRDGHADNRSWNCGMEGPTDNPAILALRGRLRRALLATLIFSQGTPMLLAGDEFGNSQCGNNNAYCQANETGWLDWPAADGMQLDYTARLIGLRARFAALRHAHWHAAPGSAADVPGNPVALTWLAHDGAPVHEAQWQQRDCIGILLAARGTGETCLLLFNAAAQPIRFTLPPGAWHVLLDSAQPDTAAAVVQRSTWLPAHAVLLALHTDEFTAAPATAPTPGLAEK